MTQGVFRALFTHSRDFLSILRLVDVESGLLEFKMVHLMFTTPFPNVGTLILDFQSHFASDFTFLLPHFPALTVLAFEHAAPDNVVGGLVNFCGNNLEEIRITGVIMTIANLDILLAIIRLPSMAGLRRLRTDEIDWMLDGSFRTSQRAARELVDECERRSLAL